MACICRIEYERGRWICKDISGGRGEEGHVLGNLPISAIERASERASGICKLLLTSLFALVGAGSVKHLTISVFTHAHAEKTYLAGKSILF